MQKKYCVIGDPVAHSLSPLIHNKLYEIYGLGDCAYTLQRVTPGRLKVFIASMEKENIFGLNVTMPLKHEVVPYMDVLDPKVNDSVNTVVRQGGKLYGHSTDAAGFRRALADVCGGYAGQTAVFIGCGNAAKELIRDAAQRGAKKITVLNRTIGNAQVFADGKTIFADTLDHINNYMGDCSLLINTTPIGMAHMPGFADLSFVRLLPQNACVCDLIYHPRKTLLLAEAEKHGHATINGLPMLVWQAFYSFEYFLGILPNEADYRTIIGLLAQDR